MILDGHIHIQNAKDGRNELIERMHEAGIDGGALISLPPKCDQYTPNDPTDAKERVENLLWWCEAGENLYSLFRIDPMEHDAIDQVAMAHEHGVTGFKVLCSSYFPGDKRPMKVFRAIAATGKPLLCHSGILWDGKPSSKYNKPAEFEPLLDIPNLKFALAHISWPWCDELVAVYGKFRNSIAFHPDITAEMFVDTTPGTPPSYRKEALTRLLTTGYDIKNNVFFGSDQIANDYKLSWTKEWIQRDTAILQELEIPTETIEGIFSENLKRFLAPCI